MLYIKYKSYFVKLFLLIGRDMTSINKEILDVMTERAIELLRYDAGLRKKVEKNIIALEKDIINQLREIDPTDPQRMSFKYKRLEALLKQVNDITNAVYSASRTLVTEELKELALTESAFVSGQINSVLGATIMYPVVNEAVIAALAAESQVMGKPISSWWAKQSKDNLEFFERQMRIGIASGDSMHDLEKRVHDLFGKGKKARRDAATIVRTSVNHVANQSYLNTYEKNSDVIEGILESATLDNRVCPISVAYHGSAWSLPDYQPLGGEYNDMPWAGGLPRHFRERDILSAIVKEINKIPTSLKNKIPTRKQASMDGLIEKPTTFDDFFKRKGEAYTDRVLGKGIASLWRDGKIKAKDVIDAQTGRPLTLKELNKRIGI